MTTEDDFEPHSGPSEDEAEKRIDLWRKSSRVAESDDEIDLQENNHKTLIRLFQSAKASSAVGIGKAARASFEVRTSTGINRRKTTCFQRGRIEQDIHHNLTLSPENSLSYSLHLRFSSTPLSALLSNPAHSYTIFPASYPGCGSITLTAKFP